ncbi:MAG TPA: hypothetical protein VL263_13965 [Vicinamibacterales bacterium]|nr:hypothetical protein [Vicinamibacterales bacterium]
MGGEPGLIVRRVVRIRATPARVLSAFFEPDELARWWDVSHAVVTPRPLTPYAVQWPATSFRDEVLGRLGGTLHGMLLDYQHGAGFFIADAYYTPPETGPIGPMAIEIQVRPLEEGRSTELTVRQSAEEEEARWRHYFAIVGDGWDRALEGLREHLEWSGTRPHRSHTWEERA